MRFLQVEWHNHERTRNGWEIEQQEMKRKIAKDEGEMAKLRRQVELLEKHVKMLEAALKNERAKSKTFAAGDKSAIQDDSHKETKGKSALKSEAKSGMAPAKRALFFLSPLPSGKCIANMGSYSTQQASQFILGCPKWRKRSRRRSPYREIKKVPL
jgi:peptidoglycan hydrolase CwlO-like protein